jgi:hypothetical protein
LLAAGCARHGKRISRALTALRCSKGFLDLIDEFSAQFATDPPRQPALPRAACREYDGEFRGNIEIFGDHLDAAIRHVRDRAVARQRVAPKLDFCSPRAHEAFALSSILQHVDPWPLLDGDSFGVPTVLQENHWNQASAIVRNESVVFKICLPRCSAAAGTAVNPV